MKQTELDRIVENEREWREYTMGKIEAMSNKVDKIDKELATFKVKVFGIAAFVGSSAGYGVELITSLFKG